MPRAVVLPLASALLLAAATESAAQQTATAATPAPKAAADSTVADVVVTAERSPVVTAIDRKTYNITRDLAGATGSVSDVLRNLPSVEVDVDGNVLLRGESSVQILVDGKPSALLSGAERGLALQQLSASTVQSIEVITNPSAEFSPDGTGGVINIVLKKVTTAGKSGTIQAGAGSQGRWNLNGLGGYKKGPLSLTGSLGVRRQAALQSQTTTTTFVDPILGQRTDAFGFNSGEARTGNYSASGQAEYDLTPRDRVSLSASLNRNTSDRTNDATEVRRNGAGVVIRDFDIAFTGDGYSHVGSLNSTWRRTFAQPGRTLTVTGSHLTNRGVSLQHLVYENRTPAGERDEHRRTENAFTSTSLTAAYVLPLQKAASLRTGYEYRRSENGQNVTGFLADASGGQTSLPNLTNNFVFVEANHQAYATYQRPFGKLTVLAGVRLELAATEYDQKTTAIVGASDYVDVHPSLHLQYALTENQNLTASYSHRVARPAGFQLNPFLIISSEFSATSGNPDLRPQETHSLDAGWQWQSGGVLNAITTLGSFETFLLAVVVAGVIQVALGYARAGVIAYYFPSSVIKGMLSGIGLTIILKQLPHAVGYDAEPEGNLSFAGVAGEQTLSALGHMFSFIQLGALVVALLSLVVLVLWDQPVIKRIKASLWIQGPLVAVALGIVLNEVFKSLAPALAISSSHLVQIPIASGVSGFLSLFMRPDFSQLTNMAVYTTAITLAVVASLETLLCVEATDKLDPQKRVTPTDRELKAQGLGNVVSGLIGGLPLTQVIVRSSANIQSGARSKLSAILHGVLLLAAVVTVPTLLNRIPLSVLAAILLVVGYKLAKPALFASMYRQGPYQFVPFMVTVVGILATDLLIGIGLGMAVAVFAILLTNYSNPFFLDRDPGDAVRITLSEDVSFLNRAAVVRALAAIPPGATVVIDASRSMNVDHDVYEIIKDFEQHAAAVGIDLTIEGLSALRRSNDAMHRVDTVIARKAVTREAAAV